MSSDLQMSSLSSTANSNLSKNNDVESKVPMLTFSRGMNLLSLNNLNKKKKMYLLIGIPMVIFILIVIIIISIVLLPIKDEEIWNTFKMEHLKAHNYYRKLHRCPPLKISREMSEFSQQWAEKIAANGVMAHSKRSGFGENIYWAIGMKNNGSIPVDTWYNEYHFYNFGIDEFSFKTGHLTQLLWKSTELIGIGVVFKNWNEIYVVTNYYPKGNIPGQFYKMVPKRNPFFVGPYNNLPLPDI